MSTLYDLEARLTALESAFKHREFKRNQEILVLRSMLDEAIEQLGVPPHEARLQYEERLANVREGGLLALENLHPSLAAELDTRSVGDVANLPNFRPLFPREQ